MIRKYILVKGLVQGIGFRPFVYKIALENNLKGYIKNSSIGVIIDTEGEKKSIDIFIDDLKKRGPEILRIEEIIQQDRPIVNYKTFEIEKSIHENQGITFIPPDLGVCNKCQEDIKDENNNRYKYPFTNCTNCGPRYSIIKALPYDRGATTMSSFKICRFCNEEYNSLSSRRFHAQPNSCPDCGPEIELVDKLGNKVDTQEPIKETIRLIKEGKILSIKGIGGFHLVCNGKSQDAIRLLREKKHRKTKPFALMMKDIETIKKYCLLSSEEEKVLLSNKRPIVILNKIGDVLPENIAPGNLTLGVMLPYTPLHYLLFEDDIDVLIMTSANLNGMPIIYENKEVVDKLVSIVDYHLMNNRDIYTSVDDSVSRVILGNEIVIRRGRGYSPTYFKCENFKESLSLGSHLKNSFCFCKDGNLILSEYIGNLDNVETLNRYDRAMETLRRIYNINPELVVYDFHPNIFSKDYLNKLKGKKVGVYHHHAHIASVLFENKEKDKVIGVAYDGSGYGRDGTIWGGEFLISNCRDFNRVGHLNSVYMPGGDMAAREPMRMAISYLYKVYKDRDKIKNLGLILNSSQDSDDKSKTKMYIEMIEKEINSPKTSSMGRFFDAVAYLLGFNKKVTFEGEAAIYLENIASLGDRGSYDFDIDVINGMYIINTDKILIGIIKNLKEKISKCVISMSFHNTIIKFTVDLCVKISEDYGIKKVALSGGVFQNKILLEEIYNRLKRRGFIVYINREIPCNDGGIALGQLVIANERIVYW
ncbi:carbamoyltransferase HypF [Clostridium vincentii]|uniref:Carbamoyltransferase n=1 Tax=Clostridium vincentii TaxID=52704 RepID=A0A2T0BCA6_9CLOT|nr:carbamoyltransferase HypF [Clostridium vincentii]PRR81531.1 Carbamoyltransferase HypF [Clostridium vincentii]